MKRVTKAVVLAAGRGSRMRAVTEGIELDAAQLRLAKLGVKAMLPFRGHPFLSYVLSAVADAGVRQICIVVAPGESEVRQYFENRKPARIGLSFAVQPEPFGTAHALLMAESFTGADDFIVLNADNYYPVGALILLHALPGSGLVGFRPEGLVNGGNVTPERLRGYAVIDVESDRLTGIIEKPTAASDQTIDRLISMTCWRFGPGIYDAARAVPRSARGEYELPDVVALAMRSGVVFHVAVSDAAVLDLSVRGDVASVAERLESVRVSL